MGIIVGDAGADSVTCRDECARCEYKAEAIAGAVAFTGLQRREKWADAEIAMAFYLQALEDARNAPECAGACEVFVVRQWLGMVDRMVDEPRDQGAENA